MLDEVTDYLCDLAYSKPFSGSKCAIFIMLPRFIGTMQSIRILGSKGYYYDVKILERSIIENLGLCVHLAVNQEEARKWLDGKDISISKIKLISKLASFFPKEREKYEKIGKAEYGRLCGYVHASLRAIISSFYVLRERPKADVKFPPFFNKEEVPTIAAYPTALLFILREVFKDELGEKWMKKIRDAIAEYVKSTKLL